MVQAVCVCVYNGYSAEGLYIQFSLRNSRRRLQHACVMWGEICETRSRARAAGGMSSTRLTGVCMCAAAAAVAFCSIRGLYSVAWILLFGLYAISNDTGTIRNEIV